MDFLYPRRTDAPGTHNSKVPDCGGLQPAVTSHVLIARAENGNEYRYGGR